ncbi:MAG TPA: hypothetical protein PLE24_05045 [Chitinispirillaceae bacterium]|jgi:hypothetical protein|nr:hypothetical protein [Chitinispirillaceae bacterium]
MALFFLIFLLIPLTEIPAQNLAQEDPAGHFRAISQTLDSLDLEKQARKRSGRSIQELESKQAILADSLQILKKKLQSTSPVSVPARKIASLPFPPQNIFDWIITIVGAAAAISGVMLVIGVLRNIAGRKKSPPVRPAGKATYSLKEIMRTTPSPLEEESPESEVSVQENNPADDLRQRVASPQYESRLQGKSGDIDKVLDPDPEPQQLNELEFNVLQAAKDGVSVQEISRRFHISADHVSLILRISGFKQK